MTRSLTILMLALSCVGCASGTFKEGGVETTFRSRDPERMVLAASQADANIVTARTVGQARLMKVDICRVAVEKGLPCMVDNDRLMTMPYGIGLGGMGALGAPFGFTGNVAGRVFHGGASVMGGAVQPTVSVSVQQPATVQDPALRAELDELRKVAKNADENASKAIQGAKGAINLVKQVDAKIPSAALAAPAPGAQGPAKDAPNADLPPPAPTTTGGSQ